VTTSRPGKAWPAALAVVASAAALLIMGIGLLAVASSGTSNRAVMSGPAIGRTADQALGSSAGNDQSLIDIGRVASETHACLLCHSTDGTELEGGTWLGLYGSTIDLRSGEQARVDDAFIRSSILHPSDHVRAGRPDQMPSYEGRMSDRELAGLVAYIRSLR